MALKDLLKAPLDTSQADARIFMERIQGNILKGHDRYHSAHIFLSFNSEIRVARSWIAGELSRRLTSAKKQSEHTKAWKATGGTGETFFAFLLSYQGYVRLGVADAATPAEIYFRAGMKSAPAGASTTQAYDAHTVSVDWQAGDLLLLDNMLMAHGRAPYSGSRRILVGMADPVAANAVTAAAPP